MKCNEPKELRLLILSHGITRMIDTRLRNGIGIKERWTCCNPGWNREERWRLRWTDLLEILLTFRLVKLQFRPFARIDVLATALSFFPDRDS